MGQEWNDRALYDPLQSTSCFQHSALMAVSEHFKGSPIREHCSDLNVTRTSTTVTISHPQQRMHIYRQMLILPLCWVEPPKYLTQMNKAVTAEYIREEGLQICGSQVM